MNKNQVKAKKQLGQHFLNSPAIAEQTADAVTLHEGYDNLLEIGPGTGALTTFLLQKNVNLTVIELDTESIEYLKIHFPELKKNILYGDFLKLNLDEYFGGKSLGVCGNFPYNISSQILFHVLKYKQLVPEVVGMFQHEVADRICSPHGSKRYGILSVLMQAFYTAEYLFKIDENSFTPPPKVKSAVIRLRRKENYTLPCDEEFFFKVVKAGFNHRRKTLRNTMKAFCQDKSLLTHPIFDKRPEQLSVEEFVELTLIVQKI
jgi:16S rRNA (adenine1518-N6/adenine1519-N6)-dimethyltransferase